jgi:hypothetical protein
MLPTSITVNTGTAPGVDYLFTSIQRDGNTVSYAYDSPQGDLLGAYVLTYKAETTGKGIVRTLEQLRLPYWNEETSKYEGDVVYNLTVARPASVPKTFVDLGYEIICEASLNADVRAAVIAARH